MWYKRGYEIQHWLDRNPVKSYLIIDNDTDKLTPEEMMKYYYEN